METHARALGVEIKDLFEFAHLQAGGVNVEEIEQLLVGTDEEKKRMIMKIVRAVVLMECALPGQLFPLAIQLR